MIMRQHIILGLSGVLYFCFVNAVMADPITYDVSVDTASLSGTTGSLDFNFNPGPFVSQSASLQILNFATNGVFVPPPALTGDVTGTLPATLTFTNSTAFNDYFEAFTFGSSLSFRFSLYGPALSSPDGMSTSGSTFAFSMFSDASGTVPALTADTADGFAFTVNVNLDGSTSVNNFSSETAVGSSAPSAVPEPCSLALLVTSMVLLWGKGRLRARKQAIKR
jgi:hypothetical protein